jgi:hypothetical protein
MTEYQWRIVIALCRLVLNILEHNVDIPINPPSLFLIRDAIAREDDKP